ncbi:hypothetical protein ACFL3X_01250 [Gemmatimonadota bacterium]
MPVPEKKHLPIIAIVAAVVALITVTVLVLQRRSALEDTGETRSAAEDAVRHLQEINPAVLDETGFRNAVSETAQSPYIASIRLFNPDGSPATDERRRAVTRVVAPIRRIIDLLPSDLMTEEQEGWLLAAYDLTAEGDHADVFNYLLRPIHGPDGSLLGMVGVTFDRSPWVSEAGIGWILGVLLTLVGLGVYWMALPLWVFLDARERGEHAWAWAIYVFIGNFVALIAYILAHSMQPDSSA